MAQDSRGFWEKLGAKRFAPGTGVVDSPPIDGWKRFIFILGTHFWKLVTLNLLFLAFCIPVVTIPAAFCGMNRVLVKLYREGNCFLWAEFWKEFRANFWKVMPFGLFGGFSLFASYYFLSLGTSAYENGVDVVSVAIGILLLIFAVLFLDYAFVFLPTLELKNGPIARNAFIFLVTEWKANLAILASVAAAVISTVMLFPYSLFTLIFFSVSLMQYAICAAVNRPLQKRIIGPYEARVNNPADVSD